VELEGVQAFQVDRGGAGATRRFKPEGVAAAEPVLEVRGADLLAAAAATCGEELASELYSGEVAVGEAEIPDDTPGERGIGDRHRLGFGDGVGELASREGGDRDLGDAQGRHDFPP
jgi:hypothetical protein